MTLIIIDSLLSLNDGEHKHSVNMPSATFSIVMLNVVMQCHCAERSCAASCYAECSYKGCCGAILNQRSQTHV